MKKLMIITSVAATLVASLSALAADAYWKQGGSGPFTDSSHWRDGKVPVAGNSVSFQGTTDAVVDDDAMALFCSFTSIQLQGTMTRLTINNTTNVTIQKGNAWFVSDGIVKKIGSGTLTLDHAKSPTMICVYGGFEVRGGELAFEAGGNQITPACPIGVFAPGELTLPTDKETKLKGLYGDGHVNNSADCTFFILSGTREKPHEFFGTFENTVKYQGGGGSAQRFLNPNVKISCNLYENDYLGTAKFPSCIFRNVCEYEYLGSGEEVSSDTIFMNNKTYCLTLNGGTNGALTVANNLLCNSEPNTIVSEIVWTGDSIKTNIMSGSQSVNGTRPVYWKKTGTGTWRFLSNGGKGRSNGGVVATEKGRLEYDDMAEKGSASPLGSASNLLSEYYGSGVDESKRVTYAYLIGDGTNDVDATTATMAYIGETEKTIKTRLVAVKGAGRFESTTAKLDWTGFTSATTGTNTLVLAGAAAGCVARDVTNGVGKVVVVKEGKGDWTVDGNYDFSSGVEARQGTLILSDKQYTWYRLTFTEFGTYCWADQLVLLNDKNENQILNLTHNKDANGNITALKPGEAAFGRTGFGYLGGNEATYGLPNFFTDETNGNCLGGTFGEPPSKGSQYTIPVVLRLPEGADKIVRYDIKSRGKASWLPDRCPTGWTLEGSRDGVNWDLLDSKTGVTLTTQWHRWYSSNTEEFTTGYPGKDEKLASEAMLIRPESLDYVAVAEGATLKTTAPQTVNGIRYDVSQGGGTLDGFAFAAAGTLDVVNRAAGTSWTLPLETVNCIGSVSGWKVIVNGRDRPGYSARLTESGIEITPVGMLLLVR